MLRGMATIRAAQLQAQLQALEQLDHADASRIVAELEPATLQRITHATRVDWLPVELHLELAQAGLRLLGEQGLRDWGRASLARAMRTTFLGPIFEGAVRLFGLSPAALVRTAPSVYQAVFRDCGGLVAVELEERLWRVVLQDLPKEVRGRAFLVAMAGALEATIEVGKRKGEVRLLTPEPGQSAEYEVTWGG
jgi:hypothetical protein